MNDSLFNEKKKYSKALKDYFKFNKKNKATWLILIQDEKIVDFLLDWLEILSCDFVIKTEKEIKNKLNIISTKDIKKDLIIWFDFILTDNESSSLKDYFESWIIPLIPKNNYLSSILHEFDPLNSEWNSFLYDENNSWSMYYSIIRYLENFKFPYDNRNLVKNIINL